MPTITAGRSSSRACAPGVALGASEGHQNHVGPGPAHELAERAAILGGTVHVDHGRLRPHDLQRRSLGAKPRRRFPGHPRPPSEEEHPPALFRRPVGQGADEVGARDLLRNRVARQAERPQDGHAVDDAQARGFVGGAETRVLVREQHVVHVGGEHRPPRPSRTSSAMRSRAWPRVTRSTGRNPRRGRSRPPT